MHPHRNGSSDPDRPDQGPDATLDERLDEEPVGRFVPRRRGTASSILMAAMLGLVDALGWERPRNETVQVADAPSTGDGLRLDFGHLPPLDDCL